MRLESTKVFNINKPVNKYQYNILLLFYKFRILTVPELYNYLSTKSETLVRQYLRTLEQMNYIAKKYDNSYHLRHQSAYYYLTNQGINAIKQDKVVKKNILHRLYKKDLTEASMQHFVDTFKTYNVLKKQYSNVDIYTKQELDHTELNPDLLIKFTSDSNDNNDNDNDNDSNGNNNSTSNKQYFIFLAHDLYPFLAKRIISKYIMETEEEDLPALLVVTKDKITIHSLLRYTKQLLLSMCIDESEVMIGFAVFDEFIESGSDDILKWTYVEDTLK